MDTSYLFILFAIGFVGAFISGMVGIGGAIISYPLLIYIPIAFGFAGFTPQEVSSITAFQVFFASLSSLLVFKKSGYMYKPLVLYMGSAIIVGSFIGGYGAKFIPDSAINMIYGMLALLAAGMMFLPKKNKDNVDLNSITFNKALGAAIAGSIGIVSGIVGAAGAFITVPVMLVIFNIPTRVAIASSLAITFISSIGTTSGKLIGGHVYFIPTLIIVIASTIASPLGAALSQKLNTKVLQWILSVLIVVTAIKITFTIFL
ncbi:sulfite exporter TauE/SafE family protein [Paenibacillus sp. N3.4]|uniref:sulfite exporter TauE/SafE family protein n=1 Tax=Paenibacillus sp. N3.4 TaxID=2603222 RepID=UPI0011C8B7D9|nr:sulfite exporter TauE/SafE family protein [Paenibacillus sp. N3.4]TXK84380.1 sulfite exporter TauE/SafE family protein [Paenibacillus sp. N3.4]